MIRHHMSHDDYLAVKAASKSVLWTIHTKSPLHAITERERTNAMEFGTAAHCAVLEPQQFSARFMRGPEDRRGNKWKEALADAPIGMKVLVAADYDAASELADCALGNSDVQALVKGADVEVSAFADIVGVACKARPDAVNSGVLIDLKTTTDASENAFRHTCHRFGYHVQEAWYRDVWQAAGGDKSSDMSFAFIVVESKPPFAIRVFELEAAAIRQGNLIAIDAFKTYRECLHSGAWPGYPRGIQRLSLDYAPRLSDPISEDDAPTF